MTGVPVLAAPAIDPGSARIELTLPEGLTIADIVAAALPGACPADRSRARVALVTDRGSAMIDPARWHAVRPRPGVRVVIRLVPGKDALRSILQIVVSIAAVALGTMFGPAAGALLGVSGQVGTALVAMGVNLLGSLLINALIPPVKPDTERRNSYSISGWRNRMDPDGAVPVVLGQIRYAPPFAASTWTEIVGDWQYLRAVFNFGEGPLDLTDFRIGETSIGEYDEVEIEVRQGLSEDAPLSLYPRQIVEESVGAELTRPLPRDDLGEVITGDPAEETPVVRTTGADASSASVILAFPGGLIRYDDKGRKRSHAVSIRIEQRLVTATEWALVTQLDITAAKTEAFYRQHSWELPSRGRWQVRVTMLTDETEDSKIQQRAVWAALQTLRPEYPLTYHRPLALVALRVKATHQLNGALDNFSAVARRVCLDWDAGTGTWVVRATSNPASLYRYVLQCAANPKPVTDAGIDLDLLADWHAFCTAKGLHYNRVQDQAGTTLREVLTEVAAAGRASPRHDGTRWGVVIDRPAELIVDHVSPRNSWGFSARRAYVEKPHAWICKFQDEGNDYKEAQRIIRRPGYLGDITLTETLDLPGLTDPAVVWREGLRRFYEAEYRPDTFELTQDGAVRVATRGDTVALSHDVLSRTQWAGRVRSVAGNLVELDETVTMVAGQTYALRLRVFEDAEDTIGTSVVRPVEAAPGETTLLVLTGAGPVPEAGDLVHFGQMGTDSWQLVVTATEQTEDQCTILRAVAAAPEIDALTDASEIPAWSSRVGAELDPNLLQPPVPRFVRISSGVAGAAAAGRIAWLIEPGSGPIGTASYRIGHRPGTSGAWTEAVVPAANGGGEVTAYVNGTTVQLRAQAISLTGVAGPWSAVVSLTVGAGDAPIPAALDEESISITTLLGGALIQFGVGADPATKQVQVYRSTAATLDRMADAVGEPIAVAASQSVTTSIGDTSRTTLITAGDMSSGAAWTIPAGWTIAGGVATHTPGATAVLRQNLAIDVGRWYRTAYTVLGRTAGTVTPRLGGAANRLGTAVSTNGRFIDRIQSVTGNENFGFVPATAFDGSVDDVILYIETAACLSQGTHYVWLEPQNDDGVPGPVAGPFSITIE